MSGGHHVQWLPLGIAALLALLSFWLNQLVKPPDLVDNAGFAHDPDYIAEQFSAQAFDSDGNPRHLLTAERMVHYMDDDTTELQAPYFRLTNAGQAPMEVRSRRGLIIGQGEAVHFLGDVRAMRQAGVGQAALTLDSEHLRVVPDAGILSSDKPVVFRQGHSVIRAGGLYADDHVLKLTGGVRGLYEKTR